MTDALKGLVLLKGEAEAAEAAGTTAARARIHRPAIRPRVSQSQPTARKWTRVRNQEDQRPMIPMATESPATVTER
jgi:hypothetical protein